MQICIQRKRHTERKCILGGRRKSERERERARKLGRDREEGRERERKNNDDVRYGRRNNAFCAM